MPLTRRLAEALARHHHMRSPRVLCLADGSALTQKVVRGLVVGAGRRAKVEPGVHILRHTFCSHLAVPIDIDILYVSAQVVVSPPTPVGPLTR